MTTDALFWLAAFGYGAGCLAAIAARSLRDFSRRELEQLCDAKQRPELLADVLHHHERVGQGVALASAALLGAAAACTGITWWSASSAAQTAAGGTGTPGSSFIAILIVVGLATMISGVVLPSLVARIAAAWFVFRTWTLWKVVAKLCLPFVWLTQAAENLLGRLTGRATGPADEETIEEEIRTIVSEGHREGLIEEEAREMIEGVMELGDAVISHIMTPRTDIHMVQLTTPWEELVEAIVDSGHSRVPVYDKSRDDIVGILHGKDLLPELLKGSESDRRPITALLRKPLFVPETKPVNDLLQFFQMSRTHIAVVLDEYGGVSGLVTIEDVLEEIVGEIDDEYDEETEADIRPIDEDTCEALGRAHVDQINERMGFELPENEDFDTIGGFVFAEFDRVPAVGETLTWQDAIRVTVLEATRRRVNRVRLERIRKESLEIA